jgi:hypothetical protein
MATSNLNAGGRRGGPHSTVVCDGPGASVRVTVSGRRAPCRTSQTGRPGRVGLRVGGPDCQPKWLGIMLNFKLATPTRTRSQPGRCLSLGVLSFTGKSR